MYYENTLAFARSLDKEDPLRKFRKKFFFPKHRGRDVIYFCGNSLGLEPVSANNYIRKELESWKQYAVEAHFKGERPWMSYHEMFAEPLARLAGALPSEVVAMNQLTVNLHLLMVSFYRPEKNRFKIITEARPFPSDSYALESQVRFHGFSPGEAIIELQPRKGEHCLRTEDILAEIEKNKNSLALVMMGGVNYFTGQAFDMKAITAAAHKVGVFCGFDLAHAMGNLALNLHQWKVDFACWCSYKYLNSGPGGIAGVFIHKNHAANRSIPRFAGWWGHDKASRFKMGKGFEPIPTAEGWQLSNAPILSMAAHKASLDIFDEAGMDALTAKSRLLTGYLQFVIEEINKTGDRRPKTEEINKTGDRRPKTGEKKLEIITPKTEKERGCQLSIIAHGFGKNLFEKLTAGGVISDWREPNVIRLAPVPLYNSFEDIYRFGQILAR